MSGEDQSRIAKNLSAFQQALSSMFTMPASRLPPKRSAGSSAPRISGGVIDLTLEDSSSGEERRSRRAPPVPGRRRTSIEIIDSNEARQESKSNATPKPQKQHIDIVSSSEEDSSPQPQKPQTASRPLTASHPKVALPSARVFSASVTNPNPLPKPSNSASVSLKEASEPAAGSSRLSTLLARASMYDKSASSSSSSTPSKAADRVMTPIQSKVPEPLGMASETHVKQSPQSATKEKDIGYSVNLPLPIARERRGRTHGFGKKAMATEDSEEEATSEETEEEDVPMEDLVDDDAESSVLGSEDESQPIATRRSLRRANLGSASDLSTQIPGPRTSIRSKGKQPAANDSSESEKSSPERPQNYEDSETGSQARTTRRSSKRADLDDISVGSESPLLTRLKEQRASRHDQKEPEIPEVEDETSDLSDEEWSDDEPSIQELYSSLSKFQRALHDDHAAEGTCALLDNKYEQEDKKSEFLDEDDPFADMSAVQLSSKDTPPANSIIAKTDLWVCTIMFT